MGKVNMLYSGGVLIISYFLGEEGSSELEWFKSSTRDSFLHKM